MRTRAGVGAPASRGAENQRPMHRPSPCGGAVRAADPLSEAVSPIVLPAPPDLEGGVWVSERHRSTSEVGGAGSDCEGKIGIYVIS